MHQLKQRSTIEFERIAKSVKLNIQQYYTHKNQQITICGDNLYNKNSEFKRKRWYLQEIRSSPLQAIKFCPEVINVFYRQHVVHKATENLGHIQYPPDSLSDNLRPCPIYKFETQLKADQKISKWEALSQMA
jgi:hypothetical protein